MRSLHNEAFIRSVLIGVVDDCRATMVNTSRVAGTRNIRHPTSTGYQGDYIILEPLSSETQRTGSDIYRERERESCHSQKCIKNLMKEPPRNPMQRNVWYKAGICLRTYHQPGRVLHTIVDTSVDTLMQVLMHIYIYNNNGRN